MYIMKTSFQRSRSILPHVLITICFFIAQGRSPYAFQSETLTANVVKTEVVSGEQWLRHLKENLIPFWNTASAKGNPVGDFSTYLCDDGSLLDNKKLCPAFTSLSADDSWITDNLDKNFTRMKARQTSTWNR